MLNEEYSKPLPLRKILTYPVVLSVSNYVTLAFLEIMFTSLVPLFMAMPIELGGLGFTPMVIGSLLGLVGAYTGVFQALFFAKLVHRFGPRGLFIVGMLTFCVYSIIYPVINIVARRTGVTWAVWSLLFIPLFLYPIKDMCYSEYRFLRGIRILTDSNRLYIYLHRGVIAEQKLPRYHKWYLTDDGVDRASYRTHISNLALLIFHTKERPRRIRGVCGHLCIILLGVAPRGMASNQAMG